MSSDLPKKKGLFILENGQNLAFTFILISSLFLLWGLCNGMIDAMDKHFQDELGLSKSQSAWVQFAHYLGYFLMALPAGWLASRLGYKGGIIAGLLMVAAGGFWFVPATKINDWAQRQKMQAAATLDVPSDGTTQDVTKTITLQPKSSSPFKPETIAFIGYLFGVCAIAAGLTFLETVANPYTTVLGPPEYSASRINLAQSCNGIGWILGPIIGGLFFYAKDASGHSIGSEMLYIPYVTVACIVLVLSIVFFFAYIPDVKSKDEFHIEEADAENGGGKNIYDRKLNRGQIYLFLFLNTAVLICISAMFTWLLLSMFELGKAIQGVAAALLPISGIQVTEYNALLVLLGEIAAILVAISAVWLIFASRKISHHSIWSHPHFSGSVLTQFLYVAAQAGIFSFFINYMTSEVPELPKFLHAESAAVGEKEPAGLSGYFQRKSKDWFEINTALRAEDIKDFPAFVDRIRKAADPVSAYVKADFHRNFSEGEFAALENYVGGEARELRSVLVQELNLLVRQDSRKARIAFYTPQNFIGLTLDDETKKLLGQKLAEDAELRKIQEAEVGMSKEQKLAAAKEREQAKGKTERVNAPLLNRLLLQEAFPNQLEYKRGVLGISEQGAAFLLSLGFLCFLFGRFSGAMMLRKIPAHTILGLYGLLNVVMCLVIFAKWGWISVACVFLSFFFMSIMFPTIFALGIHGLGDRAKKASAFLVMAIMGGAVLPKLMGYVADQYDMSRGFAVPLVCFLVVALYGFWWPKLSGSSRS